MASKRRVRRQACGGKRGYPTAEEAIRAIGVLRHHSLFPVGPMSHYKCPFCKQFHVGHTPGKRRHAMAMKALAYK
jgi:hypothetical protein